MAFLLILTNILSRVYVVCHTLVRPERCYHQRKARPYSEKTKEFHLEGQPEGLVGGPAGGDDGVKSLEEGHAAGLALLPLHVPSLVPGHVLGGLDHVVSVPSGDGDERNSGGIVADLLDEVADLLGDLLIPDDNNINDDLDVSGRVGREFVIF